MPGAAYRKLRFKMKGGVSPSTFTFQRTLFAFGIVAGLFFLSTFNRFQAIDASLQAGGVGKRGRLAVPPETESKAKILQPLQPEDLGLEVVNKYQSKEVRGESETSAVLRTADLDTGAVSSSGGPKLEEIESKTMVEKEGEVEVERREEEEDTSDVTLDITETDFAALPIDSKEASDEDQFLADAVTEAESGSKSETDGKDANDEEEEEEEEEDEEVGRRAEDFVGTNDGDEESGANDDEEKEKAMIGTTAARTEDAALVSDDEEEPKIEEKQEDDILDRETGLSNAFLEEIERKGGIEDYLKETKVDYSKVDSSQEETRKIEQAFSTAHWKEWQNTNKSVKEYYKLNVLFDDSEEGEEESWKRTMIRINPSKHPSRSKRRRRGGGGGGGGNVESSSLDGNNHKILPMKLPCDESVLRGLSRKDRAKTGCFAKKGSKSKSAASKH